MTQQEILEQMDIDMMTEAIIYWYSQEECISDDPDVMAEYVEDRILKGATRKEIEAIYTAVITNDIKSIPSLL
jgi:hypothetical protein